MDPTSRMRRAIGSVEPASDAIRNLRRMGPVAQTTGDKPWDFAPGTQPDDSRSFRDAVSGVYDDFDSEVAASQKALEECGSPFGLYGNWNAADVDRQFPIYSTQDHPTQPINGSYGFLGQTSGRYPPTAPGPHVIYPGHLHDIRIAESSNNEQSADKVLQHELTHALLLSGNLDVRGLTDRSLLDKLDASNPGDLERLTAFANALQANKHSHSPFVTPDEMQDVSDQTGLGMDDLEYVMNPAELDPRLASVRRSYAMQEGKSVRTPGDAQDAFNWWLSHGRKSPDRFTSMDDSSLAAYALAPSLARMRMLIRMTQVPAVVAPVAAAAASHGDTGEQ